MIRRKVSGTLCPRSLLQKPQSHTARHAATNPRREREVKWDYCFVALPVVDSLKHIQSDVVQSEVKMMSVGDLDGERNDME